MHGPKIILAYHEAAMEVTSDYDASLNSNGRALTEYGVNVLKDNFKSRLDVDLDVTKLKAEVITEPRGSESYALEAPFESPLQHRPVLIRYSTARGVNPLAEKIVDLNRQRLLEAEEADKECKKKSGKWTSKSPGSSKATISPLLDSLLPSSSENPTNKNLRSPVQSTQAPLPPAPETMSSSSSMDFSTIKAMFEKFEYKLEKQGNEIAALRNDNVDLRNDNADLQNDNEGLRSRIRKVEEESKASIRDSQKRNNELDRDLKHVKQNLELTAMAASGDRRAITKIRLRILVDLALRIYNPQGLELLPGEKLDAFVQQVGVPGEYARSIVKAKRLGNDVAHNADSRVIAQGVLASDEDFRAEAKALFFLCYKKECDSNATQTRYDYMGPPVPDDNRA